MLRFSALSAAVLLGLASQAQAATSLGANFSALEPVGWNVGDTDTTHQVWDVKTQLAGDTPDAGYGTGDDTLTAPKIAATPPAFFSSTTKNYYAFSTAYNVETDIFNSTGAFGAGDGTHVIVQVGSSTNGGDIFQADSLEIVAHNGDAIVGGANADILAQGTYHAEAGIPSFIGPVNYKAQAFEFFLPEYTGDFTVKFTSLVHTSHDLLRVDSAVVQAVGGASPFASTIPEPGSAVLLGLGGLALLARRRR